MEDLLSMTHDEAKATEFSGGIDRVGFEGLGKTASTVGKGVSTALKYGGLLANVGFATYGGYKDIESEKAEFSGGEKFSVDRAFQGLTGDGDVGKAGGLISEVGDTMAMVGSGAMFTPMSVPVGLALEVGGGLLNLIGGGLGEYGTYEKDSKKSAVDSAPVQQPDLADVGDTNQGGGGNLASSSQSALRR